MNAAKKLKPQDPRPEAHAEPEHGEHEEFHAPHKKGEDSEGVWLISYADMMTLLMGFFALIASFSKVDSTEFEKVKQEAVKYFGGEYERPYGGLAERLRSEITSRQLQDQIEIEETADGVKMTIKGMLLFDSGSFEIKDSSVPIMDQLVGTVAKEAKDFSILVEGHTDNVPIAHPVVASNWELSGLRAARVAHLFEAHGYRKNQLMIVGWGESKPLAPNENADGSPHLENRSKNRRVIVKIHRNQTL